MPVTASSWCLCCLLFVFVVCLCFVFVVCLRDIFRALIDSLVCRFCTGTLGLVLFHIMFLFAGSGRVSSFKSTLSLLCCCRCKGLMLLETFTANDRDSVMLPDFITVEREVTGDPSYSMFNLSLKEEFWGSQESSVQSEDDWWSLCVRSVTWLMVIVCLFSQLTDGLCVSIQSEDDWQCFHTAALTNIYHVLVDALRTHMIHMNLNTR